MGVIRLAGLPGLLTPPPRTAWAPPSPTLGAMPCSRWWGFAVEDDLDAPDLPILELRGEVGITPKWAPSGRSNGHASAATRTAIATSTPQRKSSILSQNRSWTPTRRSPPYQLLGEISASWLLAIDRRMGASQPSSQTARGDALLVEDAFRQKIAERQPLPDRLSEAPSPQVSSPLPVTPHAVGAVWA